jgi:hypothetical protein
MAITATMRLMKAADQSVVMGIAMAWLLMRTATLALPTAQELQKALAAAMAGAIPGREKLPCGLLRLFKKPFP